MKSVELGKWIPDAEGGDAPSTIPDHVSVSGESSCVPNLCRLADANARRAFAAILEAAIERAAFAASTGDSPAAAAIDADLSASPFASVLPSPDERAAYPGLNPAQYARPPSAIWQEFIAKIAIKLRYPNADLDQPANGLHIFLPFVLGVYSGNSWSDRTPPSVSDLLADALTLLSSGTQVAPTALATALCKSLSSFGLLLPLPTGADLDFYSDDYSGKGDDALVTSLLSYLNLPTSPNGLPPFAYYLGGKTSDSDDVPDENWVNLLERRAAPSSYGDTFNGLWLPILRHFAYGDESATNALPGGSTTLWDFAVTNGLQPFLDPTSAGNRLNGFLYAASAAFLSRTAPFGLFLLDANYNNLNRLRYGLAHRHCTVSCSYSIAPVTDESTNKWTGEVSVSYDRTIEEWEPDSPTTDGSLLWQVGSPTVASSSGYVTEERSIEYDVAAYLAHELSGVTGVDNVKNDLAQLGFADIQSRSKGNTKWFWSGAGVDSDYNSYTCIFANCPTASIRSKLTGDPDLAAAYVIPYDATVKSSAAASGSVSFSAKMPSEDPSEHGIADMTGLREFPCRGAIVSGYTANPLLFSFWAGSLSGSPLYAIPSKPYVLDRDAAAEADGKSFRTDHVDEARKSAESAAAKRLSNALLNRDAIASLANSLYSSFPSESTVQNAVSKTSDDAGWELTATEATCGVIVYLNDDGSINRVNGFTLTSITDYSIYATGVSYRRYVGTGPNLYTTETRNSAHLGLVLADYYPNLPSYTPWSASLAFGGCLAAFDWNWKAIKFT